MKRTRIVAVLGMVIMCMLSACNKADNTDATGNTETSALNTNSVVEEQVTSEPETAPSVVEQANVKPTYPLDGKTASEIIELLNSFTNNIEDGMNNEDLENRFEYAFNDDETHAVYDYGWFCEGGDKDGINFIKYYFYSSGRDTITLDVKDYCTIRVFLTDYDIASTVYDTYVDGLKNLDRPLCIDVDEKGTDAIGNDSWNFKVWADNGVYTDYQAGLNNDLYEVHLSHLGEGKGYMVDITIPLNTEF